MAAVRTNKSRKGILRVEVATDTYKNVSNNYFNPGLTDTLMYSSLSALGGLQSHTVTAYRVQDNYSLEEE